MNRPDLRVLAVRSATLDVRSGAALLPEVTAALAEGTSCLVLDLEAVTYMDSLGISVLITVRKRAPAGTRVCLAGLQPHVRAIARLTRLYDVFPIYSNVADALRSEVMPTAPPPPPS